MKPEDAYRVGYRICSINNGNMFAGEMYRSGEFEYIENAAVIRLWGTSEGIGQIVFGPTNETILDYFGKGDWHILQRTHCITIEATAWSKTLLRKRKEWLSRSGRSEAAGTIKRSDELYSKDNRPDYAERIGYRICSINNGNMFVGEVFRSGEFEYIENAAVIRLWGTEHGVGQIAHGPTNETVLDYFGKGDWHILQRTHCIEADEAAWSKVLLGKRVEWLARANKQENST
jgi:hypothetical protein